MFRRAVFVARRLSTFSAKFTPAAQPRPAPREVVEFPVAPAPSHRDLLQGVKGIPTGDKLLVATCEPCGTRFAKKITTHAYTKGVVLVICPHCAQKHLVADHLGWFSNFKGKTLADYMKDRGEVLRVDGLVESVLAEVSEKLADHVVCCDAPAPPAPPPSTPPV